MMQFEHIVIVNDDSVDQADWLPREVLWAGLVRRAEDPLAFIENLDRSAIIERGDNWFLREMWFGEMCVRDHVTLEPGSQVHYETAASEQHRGGSLTMTIEVPAPGVLCVRFKYSTPLPEQAAESMDAGDAYFVPWVKSAYQQADIDTIERIRELAAAGELNPRTH
jgi:hypothetical protein